MRLEVIRFSSGIDSTNGILLEAIEQGNDIDGIFFQKKFLAYTLEDEQRDTKYRMVLTNWVSEKWVAIMQDIRKDFRTYMWVCFMFLMFLALSIYLSIVETQMNTRLGAY